MFKRIILIVVILAAVGAGGYYAYTQLNTTKTSATASLQTTTVSTGSLVASVAASGQLAAPQTDSVTWQAPGHVGQINVKVGQVVHAGDVIMTMDSGNLDTSFVQAQAQLLTDQAALTTLMTPPTAQQLANDNLAIIQASQAVTTAQNTLNSVLKPGVAYYQQQLIQAQYALTATQQNAQVTEFQVSLNAAQDALTTAANTLQSIKDLNARYPGYGDQHSRLTNAQTAYNAALTTYQTQLFNYQQAHNNNSVALLNSQQALTTAQANLNAAQTGPSAATQALDTQQVTVAQANLLQAQANLATLQAGPTASDLASAKAKIAVDQALLAKTQLLAPFNGTVTEIDTPVGQSVNVGTQAVMMADLSSLQVQVQVSEVDVARVKVGQPVNLTLDAEAGKTFTGTVADIGYLGTTTQGVVNYPVTVLIGQPDGILKPGMTAAAAVVTDQKTNVLVVPNRAIHVAGGQRSVTVLFEGQLIPVTVQVGLSNDTESEITGGQLKAGDTIVLNTPAATSTGSGGGGFGGGGFGGGGFARGG